MEATFSKYNLIFKRPSGTSRGILTQKETFFLTLTQGDKKAVGECGLFKGLSADDTPFYMEKLSWLVQNINLPKDTLMESLLQYPSIVFGLEQALICLNSPSSDLLFPSPFTSSSKGIPINGLIWMGSADFMKEQIKNKLKEGFSCIKMKIGAIDFETEYSILKQLRKEFSPSDIEIRVDANGAFSFYDALEKLDRLSKLSIHSIEQPIRQNQRRQMSELCRLSPLPIALDEELIGVFSKSEKQRLLEDIKPHYIILKPSLHGGFSGCEQWIELANQMNIGWWVTSALESNVGLNAIAQWTYMLNNPMPQGLGTGALYINNTPSKLFVKDGYLFSHPLN